jgi:hypothetical protein
MITLSHRISLVILLSLLFQQGFTQDDWNVSWHTIGDSTSLIPKQKIIVTGKISVKGSKEPVAGASISAETFKYFDYSDQDGSYILELPPGRYRIMVRHVGMKPVYLRLRILSSGLFNIEMEEGSIGLEEIVITSRAIDSNVKQSLPGLTTLNVQEIKSLPTLMGEVDILRSLQLLPGVSSVGEGSSGFNVRGGRMDQNLILLNDVPLFNSAHALGFVSAFNQDVIKDFSLYKGNVPANYGGRAASVLEIITRRGDFDKWKFQGGVGPITSRFSAEGPIKSTKSSLLLSGRISHANWVLKKARDPNVKKSRLSFYDAFAGWSHRFTQNSTADITFYTSADEFQYSNQFGYSWNNYLINARWQSLTNRNASPTLSLAYGHFESTLIDPSGVEASTLTNTLNYLQLAENVNYEFGERHRIVAGISGIGYFPKPEELEGYRKNPNIQKKSVDKNSGAEFAIFLNDDYEINERIGISVGLRYSHYVHLGDDTVYTYLPNSPKTVSTIEDTLYYGKLKSIKSFGGFEPRISARFSLTRSQSVKVSYNRMRQYIHLISNTTSPTPIDLWQVSNEYLPPQITNNYSVGYFLNLNDNRWETSVEFFYKDMRNLVEYKDFPTLFLNDHLETELLTGKGRAFGGEFYVRKLKGKWTGWISYTYSQTKLKVASENTGESVNDGEWYASNYNKPHIFHLVVDRKLRDRGAFSIILSYNTGRPLTAIESSYIVDGTIVPVYSQRNAYKIPDYLRVDLSFTVGNVIKKLDDSLIFSVYNLLGRDNAYSVFYQRPGNNFFIPKPYKLSVLGAVLPSLTYNFKF